MNAATIVFLIISIFSYGLPAVFAETDNAPAVIAKVGSFFMMIYACILVVLHFMK